jgi:hypothetical protein
MAQRYAETQQKRKCTHQHHDGGDKRRSSQAFRWRGPSAKDGTHVASDRPREVGRAIITMNGFYIWKNPLLEWPSSESGDDGMSKSSGSKTETEPEVEAEEVE